MAINTVNIDPIDGVAIFSEWREQPDQKTGELMWTADAIIPGKVNSRNSDEISRGQVRLRCKRNPGHGPGSIVRVSHARMSTWLRRQGREWRTGVTLTGDVGDTKASSIPPNPGPLAAPDFPAAMYLGRSGDFVDLLLPPEGPYQVDGLLQARITADVPDELLGQQVRINGLQVVFTLPARETASAFARAELVLRGLSLEAVSNGRRSKVETPAEQPAVAS